ncbi:MAG: transaldolase [Anaerolineae bacterium]
MMTDNHLQKLQQLGQSVWLDYIDRTLLASGELQRMVDAGEVTGVTSNPTIFQKAIATCDEYDATIRSLDAAGKDTLAIWEALSTADIAAAASILEPVHKRTEGRDGYVSIEVAPSLAHDADGTIAEARHLFRSLGRRNVMIKVPATREGVEALEELTAEGINVNATLIFSPENYVDVASAYIRGLHRLAAAGGALADVASVASFFVSRVDSAVDSLLQARIQSQPQDAAAEEARNLLGQAAVANAKIAYQAFGRLFSEEAFGSLRAQGAHVQRPLWASTSTKNPAYRDVYYVEELIGPDTVNTMPPATLEAFRDHGRVRESLTQNVDQAHTVLARLQQLGIDLHGILADLQTAGIEAFAQSFAALFECIRERQARLHQPQV